MTGECKGEAGLVGSTRALVNGASFYFQLGFLNQAIDYWKKTWDKSLSLFFLKQYYSGLNRDRLVNEGWTTLGDKVSKYKNFIHEKKKKFFRLLKYYRTICNILEYSGTFWNILEHSGTFWNILEYYGILWNIKESPRT